MRKILGVDPIVCRLRERDRHLNVMVTADELAQIHGRMAEAGISNAGAYMRKMALNGYIL